MSRKGKQNSLSGNSATRGEPALFATEKRNFCSSVSTSLLFVRVLVWVGAFICTCATRHIITFSFRHASRHLHRRMIPSKFVRMYIRVCMCSAASPWACAAKQHHFLALYAWSFTFKLPFIFQPTDSPLILGWWAHFWASLRWILTLRRFRLPSSCRWLLSLVL